ncbi:hypothetical protein [Cupriavidus oxalaticus]|uniref:DNA-binding protein n=1 Tax=Cupriavidus oxalaticus TaxID=96344 RepID=A0A5P3VJV1_9BURK|nr:hypothetical protein [Cupriavidus oxalaticus]QEZ45693.1 hypothetical protein D2917_15310 [Cupriavidus oxalaticus]
MAPETSSAEAADKLRIGRPPKAPPKIELETLITFETAADAADCSRRKLLDLEKADPTFPRCFNFGGIKVMRVSEWNAYIRDLRSRGFKPPVLISEKAKQKARREAEARAAGLTPAPVPRAPKRPVGRPRKVKPEAAAVSE